MDPVHREHMIVTHLPLVRYVARSMARYATVSSIVDGEDLMAYGSEGLIRAVDTFDPAKSTRFSTWAVLHIRTAILDALRALDPLPRRVRALSKQIEQVSTALANQSDCWPDDADVARALGMPLRDVQATMQQLNRHVVSLEKVQDSRGGEGDWEYAWLPTPADHNPTTDPEAVLERIELRRRLLRAVNELPERQARLLRMYYGQGRTIRAIGEVLNVSESRVSQLHTHALKLLRKSLSAPPEQVPNEAA